MNDLLVTVSDKDEISKLKVFLKYPFQIKKLRNINYFLRLQFDHVAQGMVIHQQRSAQDILTLYSMNDYTPVSTPLPSKLPLFLIWIIS